MVLPEIRLLQAAIALAEELNFSRAAERLRALSSVHYLDRAGRGSV